MHWIAPLFTGASATGLNDDPAFPVAWVDRLIEHRRLVPALYSFGSMALDWEQALQEKNRDLETVNDALSRSQHLLSAEVQAAQQLQRIATQLITATGAQALYEEILDAAQLLLNAAFATIQQFHPERGTKGELRLLGHRGFSAEAVSQWEWVHIGTQTTCGEALRTLRRVVVPDLRNAIFMVGTDDLEKLLNAGIRGAQTTPLVSRSGVLLGMVSTYWREPYEPTASELRSLDVLARLAADLVERSRAEEVLRENQQRLESIYNSVRDPIFHVAVEPEGNFRFISVNAAFARETGLSLEMVAGKTLNEVVPEPSLTIILRKCRQAIENRATVFWEETSDYPTGRLTGEVSIVPVFDDQGACTYLVGSIHDLTELKRAGQKFHAVLEAAPDAMVVVDREGNIVLTNAQVDTLFGYRPDELYGRSIDILLPERFRANNVADGIAVFRQPAMREMSATLELYGLRKSGREFPVEVRLSPLKTEGETLVISAIRDATERKQAEAALRESEARLALAQNAAQLGVWDSDLVRNVITICGMYAQIHGLSPDRTTITQEEWRSLLHPDDREGVEGLIRDARERSHSFDAEFRIIWRDGSVRWVHAKGSVLVDESGQPNRSMGVIWDITARKQSEARLRESEERFRRVFEEGPLGIALSSKSYSFLKVNSALCQMLGYSEEELLQKTLGDITHPEDVRGDVELSERLFKGEIPFYRIQKRYLKRTGEIIWINLTASLLRDRDGNSSQRLTMIEDITRVKRNQEEAILRQKLESVGTLAGGIAHDFNNLLGAVLAQAELAQAELEEGSKPEGELKAIRDIARRGSEIVRELLIYAGKESKILRLVDVSQAIGGMLELLKLSVSKLATFKTDLAQDLPPIRANAAQISQLVMNLAINASEALGDGNGAIGVTTRHVVVGHDPGKSPGSAEGEYVQIEVSDTGFGISPETQARIFDPFFSTKSGGRGLGLAVVHGIVKDLGGSITLVSEMGRGTTFQISLPCAEIPSETKPSEISRIIPRAESQGPVVLIVEDEDALRQAVSNMLGKNAFSVMEAGNGSVALDLIRDSNNTIDTIVLDITLPGASAREVFDETRRLRPETKIIVTSAYPNEMGAALLQRTIEHFLRKPYRVHDLVQMIDAVKS